MAPLYAPGDFVRSRLAAFWTALIVEYRPAARGKVPGYLVRRWDGKLDWIGEDDIILAARALDAETCEWIQGIGDGDADAY